MEIRTTLWLIVILLLFDAASATILSSLSQAFSPIVIEAKYGISYQSFINSTIEYVYLYPASNVSLDEINSFVTAFHLIIE